MSFQRVRCTQSLTGCTVPPGSVASIPVKPRGSLGGLRGHAVSLAADLADHVTRRTHVRIAARLTFPKGGLGPANRRFAGLRRPSPM